MQFIKFSAKTPEENIALDEVFLTLAECGELGETLRLWESSEYFVVLGRAAKAEEECFLDICRRDSIKVIRRISGGGTVLQGPGCLNYSLILSYEKNGSVGATPCGCPSSWAGTRPAPTNVVFTYWEILGRIVKVFKNKGVNAEVVPLSDIAVGGKKFSGNAQARKRKFFLHHGTILFDFDIKKIPVYLKHPLKEPEYRKKRAHEDFLANISMRPEEIEDGIKKEFLTNNYSEVKPLLDELILQKYSNDNWNLSF